MSWSDVWDLKFDTARGKAVLDARRPSMLTNVQGALGELEALEGTLRAVLTDQSLDPLFYGMYHAACLRMYGIKRKWPGGDFLDKGMAGVIADFTLRGLTALILLKIAVDCFGWTPPAP